MMATSEATDAKLAAAEARLRGEMGIAHAELIARMDMHASTFNATMASLAARLIHIEEQNRSTRANVWSAAAFVVGSMIAIIALLATVAPYAFDKGAALHDSVAQEVRAQLARR